MKLPQAQAAVLRAADADEDRRIDEVAAEADLKPETATRAAFELEDQGLVTVTEETVESVELTEEGDRYVDESLPEQDLYTAAVDAGADEGPVSMGEAIGASSGLEGDAVDIALSNYARKGYGQIDSGEITADPDATPGNDPEMNAHSNRSPTADPRPPARTPSTSWSDVDSSSAQRRRSDRSG